jgi:hypothetical protein
VDVRVTVEHVMHAGGYSGYVGRRRSPGIADAFTRI